MQTPTSSVIGLSSGDAVPGPYLTFAVLAAGDGSRTRILVSSSHTKNTVSRSKNSAAFWTERCQSALIYVMIIRIVKESCNPSHLGVTVRGGFSLGLSLTIDTPAGTS